METDGAEGGGGEAERRRRSELGRLLEAIGSSEGLELAGGEGWQRAGQEECVLNKADDVFPTLETMGAEVEPAPTHLAVGMRRGAMATWSLAPVLSPPPQKASHWCTHCATEKTSKWLQGPDGPGTLCNACGQGFKKGRLLHSNSRRCGGRRSSSMENSAAGNDVAALVETLPCGVGASLDAFFDQTGSEVSWEAAGPAERAEEEEELEWLSNKDAFPSVETMALEVEMEEAWSLEPMALEMELETMAVEVEEEASTPDVPWARTKGRQRVTAMETACRQANVLPHGDLRAEKGTVRRCTHCGTEETPRWRKGPEGPHTLCNACGAVYNRKGGLLAKETVRRRCIHCASEKTSRWNQGPDGPGTPCDKCGKRFLRGWLLAKGTVRQCTRCATEKTPQWREGPEGLRTLCNACGLALRKKRRLLPEYRPANSPALSPLVQSNIYSRALEMATGEMQVKFMDPPSNGPPSSPLQRYSRVLEEEMSAAGHVAAAEARRGEESMEVQLLLERPPVDNPAFSLVSRARTKGVTAMEKTCRQVNVPRAEKETTATPPVLPQRRRLRCTHCATENTPEWREGPEGPHSLCNACGMVFRKKGRLLAEYRPANSPAFSPLLHSSTYARALKMHSQNEATPACHGEVHIVLMEGQQLPLANGPTSGSPLPLRLNLSEEASGVIRATAEARRAERAAAFLAAMDN
ncbi:unnamed protein product [Alopecurus aequalis]